jgi:hypothetical protein
MLTYADLNVGIPNMIICLEMVPFSLFFHYAYSYRTYIIRHGPDSLTVDATTNTMNMGMYQGGFLGVRAWVQVLNPKDLLQAIAFAFQSWSDTRAESAQRPATSYELLEPQYKQSYPVNNY